MPHVICYCLIKYQKKTNTTTHAIWILHDWTLFQGHFKTITCSQRTTQIMNFVFMSGKKIASTNHKFRFLILKETLTEEWFGMQGSFCKTRNPANKIPKSQRRTRKKKQNMSNCMKLTKKGVREIRITQRPILTSACLQGIGLCWILQVRKSVLKPVQQQAWFDGLCYILCKVGGSWSSSRGQP